MTVSELKRKLTAILSADVKGYSRLMGEDEEWTVRTLDTFKGVMKNIIPQHRGRVVDSTGDNLLAEFASVVDAVQAAVEIQQVLRAKNSLLPESRRMEFRIGINLGDVIEEGERIFGDGVNIAARLEGMAEAGGICISGSAFEQIENKLPLHYDYLGEHEVKNITRPVRVYRALMDNGVGVEKGARPTAHGSRGRLWAFGLAAVMVVIAGTAAWHFFLRPAPPPPSVASKPVEKADPQKMAFPLPDKPSIAVLPFTNLSDDREQEYFADGLAEEIINALSKVDQLFVIARNSTFSYKGKSVKVQQVAEEMGVRYVLEGSVRKAGDKVRVTAQLVDALNGRHIFSESYDRDFKDILSVQDEITMNILSAMQFSITSGEYARVIAKGTKNLNAYLKTMQARQIANQYNKESFSLARRFAEEAIELDPNCSNGYYILGVVTLNEVLVGANKLPRAEALQEALRLSEKAAAFDQSSNIYALQGVVYSFLQNPEKAMQAAEQAIALSPSNAVAYDCMGAALMVNERFHDAIPMLQKALRLSPIPHNAAVLLRLGACQRFVGQNEESAATFKRVLQLWPENLIGHALLTAAYSAVGRDADARGQAAEVMRIDPNFTAEGLIKRFMIKNKPYLDKMVIDLRKAGLK
jgi:adenylate cyclase